MATSLMSGFIQHLRGTLFLRDSAGLTDGQLLTDYISSFDEASLAALVHRHGPMVWGVCRRVLHNYHDAEDAFQATFLVLIRKAAAIESRELLANWLYGVARQTALKARATAAKRNEREWPLTNMPEPAVADQGIWRELQPLLDEEVSRLPGMYRVLIVLCDLEGKTRKEVARQLNLPEGTVAGRLARARAMLAKRLSRRGVVVPGAVLGAVVSAHAASACVPTTTASSTMKTATLFAVGQEVAGAVSPRVAGLITGVTKDMFMSKIKSVLAVALVVGLALAGGGVGAVLLSGPAATAPQSGGGNHGDPHVLKGTKVEEKPAPKKPDEKSKSTAADEKRELNALQGTWRVVGVEEQGNKVHEEDVKAAKETFVIKGRTITYCRAGKALVTMKFTQYPEEDPPGITLEFTDVKEKGSKNHAIYNLDGDTLKLRMNDKFGGNSEDEQPTDFSTDKGKEAVLFILKRETNTGTQEEEKPAPEKQGEKSKSAAADEKRKLDTLQGTWLVVGVEEQGNKVHEKDVKEAKETFVIKGRTMTYCRAGEAIVTMKFTRYPEKDPPAITLVFTEGNEKGYKNHAIYKLDGDTLKLRMNDKFGGNSEDERPTDFSTDRGKEAVLFILKRETK